MTIDQPYRNAVPRPSTPVGTRPGRHARAASPPAGALADVIGDQSMARLRAADAGLLDAQLHIRAAGADSDSVASAFASARAALSEAGEVVREARRELSQVLSECDRLLPRPQASSPYPSTAAPVVPDLPGESLCPDPGTARTPAEFMRALRRYREWAGSPSYRAMAHVLSNPDGRHFAASTLHAALAGDELPAQAKVRAIISACGGTTEHELTFTAAWRRLSMPLQEGERPPQPVALFPVSEPA